MKRRQFLGALAPLLAAPSLVGLTRKAPPRIDGTFVDDGGAAGHRLRDGARVPAPSDVRQVPVVIVGGGMAGLSAAWQLRRKGMQDFVILELEKTAGGNSRSGENEITRYPWAAHYVPIPNRKATLVRELFEELGVLRDGQWEERYLCFAPQERLFLHGEWREGIEPAYALDGKGRSDFARFDEEITKLRETNQFTIPMAQGAPRESALDGISMAAWLDRQQINSPAVRWYVDYACRDDFGALAAETSAWAGIHYFASREDDERGPLTWPEGNGWIAKRLLDDVGDRLVTSSPVMRIERQGVRWKVSTPQTAYVAEAVVFAAPTFTLPHLLPSLTGKRPPLVYSPWLTANLTLRRRPALRPRSAPPSWDNVIYGSPSLGYVDATHQSLRTHHEGAVWTYYWALAEMAPATGRQLLLKRSWAEWAELILADLERAHSDIRECVSRIDIMRMGHAMVRPTTGFLEATSQVRRLAEPGLYLANSDVSGISLFEEAQYRGVVAATSALERLSG